MSLRAQTIHSLDPFLGGTAQPIAQILRRSRRGMQGALGDEFRNHNRIIAEKGGRVKTIYSHALLFAPPKIDPLRVAGILRRMLYPFQFQPIFKTYLWGGRHLDTIFRKPVPPTGPVAESWEIVDRAEENSVVVDQIWPSARSVGATVLSSETFRSQSRTN